MTELERALRMARDEITRLRRENEILHAKVEVMDLFACVLHTTPARNSQGMAEDAAWLLGKQIDAIEDAKGKA